MDRRGGSGGATRLARADDEQVAAQVSVRARRPARRAGRPSPTARRIIRDATAHAQRGRMNVL